jgi:hypothetical protein
MVLGVRRTSLAPQILAALEEVITGGAANDPRPSVGIYRSATDIVRLFNRAGFRDSYESWSRVSHVTEKLDEIYRLPTGTENILRVVEEAVSPRDYVRNEDRLQWTT